LRHSRLNGRSLRTVFALAVAFSALTMLGVLGGVGFAKSSVSAGQYQYGPQAAKAKGKEVVCHKGKTINVAKAAVKSHQKHGDTLGACASDKRKGKNKGKTEDKPKADDATVESAAEREADKAKHEAEARAEKAKEEAEKRAEHAADKRAEHEAEKAKSEHGSERDKNKEKGKGK
jgi:colicin import membrane protein